MALQVARRCPCKTAIRWRVDTGATALATASHALGASNLPDGYVQASHSPEPLGMEIALVTDDVAAAHAKAVTEGAVSIKEPLLKPLGTDRLLCPMP